MIRSAILNGTRSIGLHGNGPSASFSSAGFHWRTRATALPSTQALHLPSRLVSDGDKDEAESRRPEFALVPRAVVSQTLIARSYHTTAPAERGAAIALSLGAVAALAKAGQLSVRAYKEWKDSLPEVPAEDEKTEAGNEGAAEGAQAKSEDQAKAEEPKGKAGGAEGKRENFFAKFFNMGVGSKYYEGGFEEKMTRREAALILGVRESSSAKRIKEAHRKLLILNHPDTGGSTYMAGKINEAKELLMKGKSDS
eukprot:CAMPEP_0183300600 /NCGR_PEP_ID=MMETSP0160_2-20130417/6968_1 /TAXON_ID=2839 ORGANISM="Odontella Sinensis, Strain Grunow 1884" /NCGR_SAMPLE_ID=MMETSP0160_2 /ASSEMBLY_ACC=CAM_ASM_000250 /LENGTH=252 /DNA_ID=CAMNT_0025463045 /DNA_START=117 /DNA_END=875 /DNA_ORIENTATION=-